MKAIIGFLSVADSQLPIARGAHFQLDPGRDAHHELPATKFWVNLVGDFWFDRGNGKEFARALDNGKVAEALCMLDGFFTAFITDKKEARVIIAQDPFGYRSTNVRATNKQIEVSDNISELSGIKEFNIEGFIADLSFTSTPPPVTWVRNVEKVRSAEYWDCTPDQVTKHKYWNPFGPVQKLGKFQNVEEAKSDLEEVFLESTGKLIEVADHKIGVSLSGGVDSGGTIGIVKHLLKKGEKCSALTVAPYGDESRDLLTAKYSGEGCHHHILPAVKMSLDRAPQIIANAEQPTQLSSLLLMDWLLTAMPDENIFMTGFGIDMIAGTHGCPRQFIRARHLHNLPNLVRAPLFGMVKMVPGINRNKLRFAIEPGDFADKYLLWKSAVTQNFRGIFQTSFQEQMSDYWGEQIERIRLIFSEAQGVTDSIPEQLVALDLEFHATKQTNAFEDYLWRTNQTHIGIPYYTKRVAETAMRLTDDLRSIGGWNKKLLREILKPYCHPEVYEKGRGSMIIPHNYWCSGDFGKKLITYLQKSEVVNRVITPDKLAKVDELVFDFGYLLLELMTLDLWYRHHICGDLDPQVGLFEMMEYKPTDEDEQAHFKPNFTIQKI